MKTFFAILLFLTITTACGGGGDNRQIVPTTTTTSTTTTSTTTSSTSTTTTTTTTTTLAAWVGTAGTLSGFSWHAPAVDPDASHAFGYGGVNYAPNGDLYLFYNSVSGNSNQLEGIIRRSGSSSWTTPSFVGYGIRTANTYFTAGGVPYTAVESGSWCYIFTSSDSNTATVHWTEAAGFAAADSGQGAFENGYVTMTGTDLNLYYTFLYYSPVFGSTSYGIDYTQQSNGTWNVAAGGWPGNNIGLDVPSVLVNHGVTGAFQDNSGNVFVLSSQAFRSTDAGANFTRVKNQDTDANNLNGVIAAAQNATDGSIILANVYSPSYATSRLKIWGTRDYGATFSSMLDLPVSSQIYHGALATNRNLVVLAVATGTTDVGGNAIDQGISVTTSYDGGVTWSALTQLVDVTSGGANPNYKLGSIKLTANPNTGAVVLMYSILNGTTRQGIYLKEFY